MLAEAFLSTMMYREMMAVEKPQDRENVNTLQDTTSWRVHHEKVYSPQERELQGAHNAEGVAPDCKDEEHRIHKQLYPGETVGRVSQAMCIPKRDPAKDNDLDLYTSWSSMYASIYKNYPDLHIGGDHILNKKDSGCVLDLESEFQDGPVLLSVDIDSSSPPVDSLGGPLVEGVLHSDESNLFPSAPFSNSVLNGFLEKKMQELYKQFYEENLVTNASPNTLLWSNILRHNVHQISMQISQEQNIEHARAKEAILQRLYCTTSGGSSEFITPILHISNLDSKKQSGTAPSNSPLTK